MIYTNLRLFTLFVLFTLPTSSSLPLAAQTARPEPASDTTAAKPDERYAAALRKIQDTLETRRKELGIPGVALAIVKDDQIIYLKGLGYKDFEKQVPVTADTRFAIGSATKAFTALTVLLAQDSKKLGLDDSPKKYLPYFKMFDPEADKNITLRDLLSHSSGLNRTDLAWVSGRLKRAEIIEVAAQAKPTAKLREKFQYQNVMFVAAGEAVSVAEKMPFDRLVKERIFAPLGMKNSDLSITEMQRSPDYSFGYSYNIDTKTTERLPMRNLDEIAPAGAIDSSARDMAEWVRFVLNGGAVGGRRLISDAGFAEWTKPQMKTVGSGAYGLGWFIESWNGLKVLQHGGNIDGFTSMVAAIPEKKLGFVLLTNVSASPLGNEMMPIVWDAILNGVSAAAPVPASAFGDLVGTYRLAAANVDVTVKADGGKLVMIVPGQPPYTLEATGNRQFRPQGAPDGFSVTFAPASGEASELELRQPGAANKLARVKAGDAAAARPPSPSAAAKELVGIYATPDGGGTVEVRDGDSGVSLNITGQQPYVLIDKAKDSFSLSPLPASYWLKVTRDVSHKVTGFVVVQPEGEFAFTLKGAAERPKITVDELMQKTIEAAGGEKNLRKITSRLVEADVVLENQGLTARTISYAKAPNKIATETTFIALNKPIASGWEYFDGAAGSESYSFAPPEPLTGKRLEDVRIGADIYAPLDWKTNFKKIEIKGVKKINGEDAFEVEFEPEKGTPVTEYYSTATYLLVERRGVLASSTSSQLIPYRCIFSDYRLVDGVKLPFKTVTYSVSSGNSVATVKSIKHNVAIDDAVFGPRNLK